MSDIRSSTLKSLKMFISGPMDEEIKIDLPTTSGLLLQQLLEIQNHFISVFSPHLNYWLIKSLIVRLKTKR